MEAFQPRQLPLSEGELNPSVYMEALIDATARLEVYRSKLDSSKLDRMWFLPTLQQKEALSSSLMEGTQATLDGVLVDQVNPSEKDQNLSEVRNYLRATEAGYSYLKKNDFSIEFFKSLHKLLMQGNVRRNKSTVPGDFRIEQNYIGHGKSISYIPPIPQNVESLMENLTLYLNNSSDGLRPLVRTAIIHAQFETIHPFMDGNGRVGRMLIPLYLYKQNQISLPCFFISEALERDKFRYYDLLNGIRSKNDWGAWINFFLYTVEQQCSKYIAVVDRINALYETDLERAKDIMRSNKLVDVINLLYKYPVISTAIVTKVTGMPATTVTRYLNALVEHKILYTDGKSRNRTFFYYDLLNIIRS